MNEMRNKNMDKKTGSSIVENTNLIENKSSKMNLLLGILIFFVVSSTAILHSNQNEFILERFGLDEAMTSYYDTALYAAFLIVGIILGFFANKTGKRVEFIIIGSSGGIIFFWCLTLIPPPQYGLLLFFRFIQGSFTILAWQSIMTLTLDISNPTNRGKNMAIFGIFLMLAMGLGSMFGGIMSERGIFVPYYFSMIFNDFKKSDSL